MQKPEFVGRHTCIDILGDILGQLGVGILNHTLLVILLKSKVSQQKILQLTMSISMRMLGKGIGTCTVLTVLFFVFSIEYLKYTLFVEII